MTPGIYTVSTGMIATQRAMDLVANNLANSSTNGFKQDGLFFGDVLEQQMATNGGLGEVIGSLGSGAEVKGEFTDLNQGSISATNNPLDVAIEGQGMLAVQTASGEVKYTRDGSLTTSDNGTLMTKQGYPVLDPNGNAIIVPPGVVSITRNGQMTVDGSSKPFGQIGIFRGNFAKEGSNLYKGDNTSPISLDGADAPGFKQGSIEGSNVNAVIAMTQMVEIGRVFEMSQKTIQSQDDEMGKLIASLNQ